MTNYYDIFGMVSATWYSSFEWISTIIKKCIIVTPVLELNPLSPLCQMWFKDMAINGAYT